MEVYDLKNKRGFIKIVMELEHDEWATNPNENRQERITRKVETYLKNMDDIYFCKLVLLDNDELIGFISIFPHDSQDEPELSPWYATMFVRKEYRGRGYSKILNDAILKEAQDRGIKCIYLKTDLTNYYEKFGAKYIRNLSDNERLMKFELF